MKFEKIHNKGQAQVFRNQYLEYLTKTHPVVIWGMYLPVVGCLPFYGASRFQWSVFTIAVVFILGIFFWTLFEYLMHRFVFHWAANSERGKKFTYVLHGNHHKFPRDKQRLFMPPVPSVIISSLIFLIMYVVMSNFVFIFFPGFLLGYLLYGSMHYAIHAWHPPFRWMKPIWRNHHLHHYKSDEQGFGVSIHLWDKVFKTGFDAKKETAKSQITEEVLM